MSRTSERNFADRGGRTLRDSQYGNHGGGNEKRSRSPSPPTGRDGRSTKNRRDSSPPVRSGDTERSRRGSPRYNNSSSGGENRQKRRRSPTPEPRNRGAGNANRNMEKPRQRSRSPLIENDDMRQQILSHGSNAVLDEAEEEERMRRMMGFSSFDTTKNKKHADVGEAQISVQRRYRQYMNRKGGFNRPLDPIK